MLLYISYHFCGNYLNNGPLGLIKPRECNPGSLCFISGLSRRQKRGFDMAFEQYQPYLTAVINIFALLTSIMSLAVVLKMKDLGYKEGMKRMLVIVFMLLGIGFFLYAAAEILYSIMTMVTDKVSYTGVPDYFWMTGAIIFIIAYSYFSFFMYRQHGKMKLGLPIVALVFLVSASLVYYIISNYILGYQYGETAFRAFLDYYYPITSAAAFIASVSVFIFLGHLRDVGGPMLLLASSNLAAFFGDTLLTYYSWGEFYGRAGVLSDAFYILQYVFSFAAFLLLYNVLKGLPVENNAAISR